RGGRRRRRGGEHPAAGRRAPARAHPRGSRMSLKGAQAAAGAEGDTPPRIGPYEILGVLGRGQSATIYLGRELFPARDVAIKVYDPEMLKGEDGSAFRALFLKETMFPR